MNFGIVKFLKKLKINQINWQFFRGQKAFSIYGGIIFVFLLFLVLISAPRNSQSKIIHIGSGDSLRSITLTLEKENVIRYPVVLQSLVIFLKNDKQVSRGDYLFKKRNNCWKVAWMLAKGKHNIDPIKITFPEGVTNQDIAKILSNKIPNFDKNLFIEKTLDKQGYLFPDTYFIFPLTTQEEIISEMSANFKNKIEKFEDEIKNSGKSLEEILTMASIIEGEAKGIKDAPIISGILWKRIDKGIPLQVDVDKWTYKNKGFPPEPISNPGIFAIKSALNPIKTSYLYYLHDKTGEIHFAKTYSDHKYNITKYLK